MKQIILLFSILFFVTCVEEEKLGPAKNLEERISEYSCDDLSVFQNGLWLDDDNQTIPGDVLPAGVSDCVDLQLWSQKSKKYYDKCCYVRLQKDGKMHAGCLGLSQLHYSDITQTIKKFEEGDIHVLTTNSVNSKIYQLDCSSNYISVAAILLLCLLL